MTTIFDFLADIISKKKGTLLNDTDNEQAFNVYMIQRWLSMYSPELLKLLNTTTNRLYLAFVHKTDWYKFFLTIIPKTRFKKIYYIKKNKEKIKEKVHTTEVIKYLAKQQELSQREINEYLEFGQYDIKELEKSFR